MFSSHSVSIGNVPIVEILCPQRVGRASAKYITHLYEKLLRSQVWKHKARKPRYSEARGTKSQAQLFQTKGEGVVGLILLQSELSSGVKEDWTGS